MSKKLKIKQVRSAIGRLENQKRTIKALGLGKLNRTVVHDDQPCIRGMIRTVRHLVTVEEVDGE
jgi:large subunit ribosomal protein L30